MATTSIPAASLAPRSDIAPAPAASLGPPGVAPGPWRLLAWSAALGLVGGYVELAAFVLKCRVLDPRNLNVSRHYVWMVPLAGLLVAAGLAGLPLALVARVRPRGVSARVALGMMAFAAGIGPVFRLPVHTVACLALAAGLAAQAGRTLGAPARLRGFDRLARWALPAGLIALGLSALGISSRGRATTSAPPPAGAKNVLLIVLDTVRAQSLGLYGHDRPTSPHLARLAARGVRFDRAFATAPWTAPSHASMFTGRWPHELSIGWSRPLDATYPTLAEMLGARGYDTAGFVANTTYCSYETGLDRGFAAYRDYDVTWRSILLGSALVQRLLNFIGQRPGLAARLESVGLSGSHRKPAGRIHADFLDWLDRRPSTAPFFAFLNLYDAHHPYLVPDEPTPPPRELALLRRWWGSDKGRLGPDEVARVREAYEHCIIKLDEAIGRLVDVLDARGLSRNTLIVVTADHGEHLGEQHLYGHGVSLYAPELHVPLIVVDPGAAPAGAVVRHPASLREVPATVMERLGLDRGGASPFPGRSLARMWRHDGPPEVADLVLSEVAAPPEDDPNHGASPVAKGPLTSLLIENHHYIRHADGREELYDLDADPGETTDLAPSAPTSLMRLRGAAAALR